MTGMNASTGKSLSGPEHLAQSIQDILTTPLGSRIQRRDYGSLLPYLIDHPMNAATQLKLYAASAHAIAKFEPRVSLQQAKIVQLESSSYQLHLFGTDSSGAPVNTEVSL